MAKAKRKKAAKAAKKARTPRAHKAAHQGPPAAPTTGGIRVGREDGTRNPRPQR